MRVLHADHVCQRYVVFLRHRFFFSLVVAAGVADAGAGITFAGSPAAMR
jgi:hypothetical protein